MTQIHITYKTAKRIKEFLGESAPEPMEGLSWCPISDMEAQMAVARALDKDKCSPAYQLHDLLSKPFCEVMEIKVKKSYFNYVWRLNLCQDLANEYYHGGLPAVEAALMEMMEAK